MRRRGTAALLTVGAALAVALSGCAPQPTDDCAPLAAPNSDRDVADPSTWTERVYGHTTFLLPPLPQGEQLGDELNIGETFGAYLEHPLTGPSALADATENPFTADDLCVVEQRDLGGGVAATALWIHVPESILSAQHSQAIVALTAPGPAPLQPVTVGEGEGAVSVRFSFYVPYSGDDADEQAIAYLQGDEADQLLDMLETVELAP